MSFDTADTIPAPDLHSETVATELEKLAFTYLDKTNRTPDFWMGWSVGVREAAEYVRKAGR